MGGFGEIEDSEYIVSIYCYAPEGTFWIHDDTRDNHELVEYRQDSGFKIGDKYSFSFDFIDEKCIFYHNDNNVIDLKLKTQTIIPALSLQDAGQTLQVVD